MVFMMLWTTGAWAQTIIIGTDGSNTNGSGSDPIDDYYASVRYQTVYTAAELSTAGLTPYDELTGLGFSVTESPGTLMNYTINIGHTSATNAASHIAATFVTVRNAASYTPTVVGAGVFDMLSFNTNFVWNGTDNIVVEVCTGFPNPYATPYGGVRVHTLTNGSRSVRSDGSLQCGTNTTSTNGNRPQIQFSYIDGSPPSCFAPTALGASNITTTGADLAWTAGGSETEWDIEYGASGFTQGTGTTVNTTTNPHALSGVLTANTAYQFYVRAVCGVGDESVWAGPYGFVTPCNPYTIPYSEGFETGYTHNTAVASCISQESAAGAQSWSANNTFTDYNRTPRTGSWNAFLQYSNNDWMFIPVTLTGGQSYDLSFYARQDGPTGANASVSASYGTVNSIAGMTTSIIASSTIINGAYQLKTGTFTPASSGTYYVGINGTINGSPWYISIDDILLEETPSCLVPTALTGTPTSQVAANLAWTAPGTPPANGYEWEVRTSGAGGSGPSGLAASGSTGAGVVTDATGNVLTANTSYILYVRSYCGAGDYSLWVASSAFATPCNPYTIPYSEGFETGFTDGTIVASCISQASAAGGQSWTANTSLTTYNRTPRTGSWNAFLQYSNNDWMFIPITLTGGQSYDLSFYVRQDATSGATVSASYGTVNSIAGMTTSIIASSAVTNGTYQLKTGTFIPASSGTYYIGINGTENSSPWYISIDDILLEETPACLVPTALGASNITTTGADLAWTAGGSETEWDIEYGASGFTQGTGTTVNTTTNPHTLSGVLTANTAYQFYVRAVCGVGDESAWAGPYGFTTPCTAISTFPFTETFEDDSPSVDCWITQNISGSAGWTSYEGSYSYLDYDFGGVSTAHGGAANAALTGYSGVARLISPSMDLSGLTNGAELEFWFANPEGEYWDWDWGYLYFQDEMTVEYRTSTAGAWTTISGAVYTTDVPGWTKATFTLPSPSADYYISFRGTADAALLVIDDVEVREAPSCLVPTGLTATATSTTTANISWASDEALDYEYVFSTTNTAPVAPGTSTGGANAVNGISGLTSGSTYYLYVRANCGSPDYSTWAGPVSLVMPTLAEDFCGGAIAVTCGGGPYTGNTTAATIDAITVCGLTPTTPTAKGVWYVFTGNGDVVTASLCGSGFDTKINVFTGSCGSLTCVAGNDDFCSIQSEVTFPTSNGVSYYILIHAYGTGSGNYTMAVTCAPSCTPVAGNDDCAGSVALTVQPNSGGTYTTGNNTCALVSSLANATCGGTFSQHKDVFFSFNSGANTQLMLDLSNASLSAPLASGSYYWALYTGSCGTPAYVNCGAIAVNGTASLGTLTASTNYILRVYTSSSDGTPGSLGNYNIMVKNTPPPPANDDCAGAVALTVNADYSCAVTTSGTTEWATQSSETAPSCGATGVNDDVWYSFTATNASHRISLSNVSGFTDMAMSIYSGNCGSLTHIQCSDPNTMDVTGLTPTQVYYVRVWTYTSTPTTASFTICVGTPPPPPANDDCAGAVTLTVNANYSCGVTTAGTTVSATQSSETAPSCAVTGVNDDVWYSFTATNSAHRISLTNVTNSTDMAMSIYSGSCGSLAHIQCSDPNTMDVTGLTPTQVYYVRVWTYASSPSTSASFTICVGTPPPPPANDDCANAQALTINVPAAGTTFSATQSLAAAPCGGTADDDVWYSFVAPAYPVNIVVTGNGTFDAVVNLRSGACDGSSEVCRDLGIGGETEIIANQSLSAGQTYYVRVYSYSSLASTQGTFSILIQPTTPAVPVNENPQYNTPNLGNVLFVYPNCYSVQGTTAGSISYEGDGYNDVWYRFTAISTGVSIRLESSVIDGALELYDAALNRMSDVDLAAYEDVNQFAGGTEILNYGNLVENAVYYIRVSSRTDDGAADGPFSLCLQQLRKPTCGSTTSGTLSLCSSIGTTPTGATTTTYSFGGAGSAASSGQMLLSNPSLALLYDHSYQLSLTANYALVNGAGNADPISVSNINACTITTVEQPDVQVKLNQRCPATLYRSAYLVAAPYVCGAIGYDIEFTPVDNCNGDNPEEVETYTRSISGSTPSISLGSAFSQIAPSSAPFVGYWRVRWRPVFTGNVAGDYGTPSIIKVNGTSTSGMVLEPADNNATTALTSEVNFGLYPNPNTGDMVNLNITGITSENVFVRIMDSMGRVVYTNRYAVEGSLSTIVTFSKPLASGLYMVEFTEGGNVVTQRMMVAK